MFTRNRLPKLDIVNDFHKESQEKNWLNNVPTLSENQHSIFEKGLQSLVKVDPAASVEVFSSWLSWGRF